MHKTAKFASLAYSIAGICLVIVRNSDTSITFSTNLEHINTQIIGYSAISNFPLDGVGNHFSRWPPKTYIFISYNNDVILV